MSSHSQDIQKLDQVLHLDDVYYMAQGRMLKLLQLSRELASELLTMHDEDRVDLGAWDAARGLTEAWIGHPIEEESHE